MKLLEAALKLLVTVLTHKAAGAVLNYCSSFKAFGSRPGASGSSPETSCSIHSAVD